MNYFLLFFLLPAIALGEGLPALSGRPAGPRELEAAGPKMGPEIELRGKKQIPSMLCQAGTQAAFGVALTGVAGAAYLKATDRDGEALGPILSSAGGLGGGVGVAVACIALTIQDPAITDGYLRKIHANLLPREKAGELKLRWSEESVYRALEVTYADGRKIVFSKDPNVMEVKISPIRPGELEAALDFYQKEIFETARAVGLKPPRLDGPWNGGHIHVDLAEAFGNDPVKFKNFLLDYIEHTELADGVLIKDSYLTPAIDSIKQREAIEQLVASLDYLAEQGEKLDIVDINELAATGLFGKRNALNLNTIYKTFELRGQRSQKSAAELLKVMRLIQARIKYTNGLPPKEFHPKPVKMSLEEKRKAFRAYVEEAGLSYEEFKDLAPRKYQDGCPGFFARMFGF